MDYKDIAVIVLLAIVGVLIYHLIKLCRSKRDYDAMVEFYEKTIHNKNNRIDELYSELQLLGHVETLHVKKMLNINPLDLPYVKDMEIPLNDILNELAGYLKDHNLIEFETQQTRDDRIEIRAMLRVVKPI